MGKISLVNRVRALDHVMWVDLGTEFNHVCNQPITRAYEMQPQYKLYTLWSEWASLTQHLCVWSHISSGRAMCANPLGKGHQKLPVWNPLRLCPVHLFLWLMRICILSL